MHYPHVGSKMVCSCELDKEHWEEVEVFNRVAWESLNKWLTLKRDLNLLISWKRKVFPLCPLGAFQYKSLMWEQACQWRTSKGSMWLKQSR